jgi:endonuclease YncB( thermonuclease family)
MGLQWTSNEVLSDQDNPQMIIDYSRRRCVCRRKGFQMLGQWRLVEGRAVEVRPENTT